MPANRQQNGLMSTWHHQSTSSPREELELDAMATTMIEQTALNCSSETEVALQVEIDLDAAFNCK